MTILLFLAVLFVLILVHELGHFVVAKLVGMRVDEFGIGFPPRLLAFRKGETIYSLNALPIGGFVKIAGEDGVFEGSEFERTRAFGARPKLAQAVTLIAGVAMNALFALLLFVAIFLIGVPTTVEENAAGPSAKLTVTEVIADSPAQKQGVPLGAAITALSAGSDSLPSLTPSSFAAFTQSHQGERLTITYEYNEQANTIELRPEIGVLSSDLERPAVGVALSMVEEVKQPLGTAIVDAGKTTYTSLIAIVVGLSSLIAGAFTFSADLSQVAGPVGLVGMVGDAASFGLTSLLLFTAFISLNLAVINLLPIPALDGGRLVFVVVEALLRRPINPIWMSRVNFVGFSALILLMVAVTYNDIAKLI